MNFHKTFRSFLVATVTSVFLAIVLSPSVVRTVRSEPRIFNYRHFKQPQRVPLYSHMNVNYPRNRRIINVNYYKPINHHRPDSFILAKKRDVEFHRFVQERAEEAEKFAAQIKRAYKTQDDENDDNMRNMEVMPDPDPSPGTNESESWKHWNDWKVLYSVIASLLIRFCVSCCCKLIPKNRNPSQQVPTKLSTDFPVVKDPPQQNREQRTMNNNKNQVHKTLGEQMTDLLRRKPENFDVIFSVGPRKIQVEAVKFILKAASPVFERELEENSENEVVTDGNGIPLPNEDPTAFQLFVNLLILDTWSLDSVKSLNLSPTNMLNLLGLCRRYEITKAIRNLERSADAFIESFEEYKDTDAFLELSQKNLETLFSFKTILLSETKIFECAARWAGNKCTVQGLEPTGENYRQLLGNSLFQIRFPAMSEKEFTKVVLLKKNVLKGDEQLAISMFIALNIEQKQNLDKSQLPFKTNSREGYTISSFRGSVLRPYKITTISSFECNGRLHDLDFIVDRKILLHGFGFLGPIDGNVYIDVTVQIKRFVFAPDSYAFDSGTFKKTIFARKGKIFYFLLDEPITVESIPVWDSWYILYFSLKGPNRTSQCTWNDANKYSSEASGVQFRLSKNWNIPNPFVELLFK